MKNRQLLKMPGYGIITFFNSRIILQMSIYFMGTRFIIRIITDFSWMII